MHLNYAAIELVLNCTLEDVRHNCDVMTMPRRCGSWCEFNCCDAKIAEISRWQGVSKQIRACHGASWRLLGEGERRRDD